MNKKIKAGFLVLMAVVFTSGVMAQSLEDGKKFFFYGRYASAKNVFNQLITANPNNTDAVYWLGETELAMDDSADAKTLFQTSSMAHPGDPLLLVGLGQIELLAGQTQDARQAFETAITITKGKNIPVLNAIGYANVNAKAGDADYAIDKLKQATTLKGFKDPDVYINLGDAYRKNDDGGSAQLAYQSALQLDPKYARASYKIGTIYETQGSAQADIIMQYFNNAIAADPTFGPVYYDLYSFYYRRDVNKSRDYLNTYIANSDPDEKDCYYQASILLASGLNQQCIDKSNECIASQGSNPYPNLFGLKAYAYFALGDSINAKSFFDQYFAKQNPSKIGPADYTTYAQVLLKFPGNDSLASLYVDKAIALDSTQGAKINDAKILVNYYTAKGDDNGIANADKKIIGIRTPPFNGDYQSTGFYYYKAGNYAAAAMVFDSAVQYFPTDVYDYYMLGKSLTFVDSTMKQGLAKPAFEKVEQLGSADTATNKDQLIGAYQYLVEYYINIKKDKETALAYCDKILALDPGNAETIKNKDIISKLKLKPTAK